MRLITGRARADFHPECGFISLPRARKPSHWPFCLQAQQSREQLSPSVPSGRHQRAGHQRAGRWHRLGNVTPPAGANLSSPKAETLGLGCHPGASTEDGANTERMSVLNVCSRRCLDFNWGVMSVFLIENFILSLAPWGTEGSGLMGPQNPYLTRSLGSQNPVHQEVSLEQGLGLPTHSPAFSHCLTAERVISLRLGLVVLLAPVQSPTLRGAACRAQPLCCVQTPQAPELCPDSPVTSAGSRHPSLLCTALLLLSLLTHASFSQGSCFCSLALETSASSCGPG